MPPVSLIVVLAGLALELLAGYLLAVQSAVWPAAPWTAAAAHLLAAALVALGVSGLLPVRYRQPPVGALAFLFSVAFFVPILGTIGLLTALPMGLHSARAPETAIWQRRRIPDLPYRPMRVATDTIFLRDGLMSVLTHSGDRARRQEAVLGCRYLNPRQAVPVLRTALSDSADDVRLLAYSMLAGKEGALEEQIGERLTEVERHPGDGELHEELAELYWEYAYLDLARAGLRGLVLDRALHHVDVALEAGQDPGRLLMRGRICTATARYDEARDALQAAEDMGIGADKIAPHRAELWFRRGEYSRVPDELRRLSVHAQRDPNLNPLVAYWL